MESPQQKQLVEQLQRKLIQDLVRMRDLQTQLSLSLHDLLFELDTVRRSEAIEQACACIARSESRQP